MAKWHDSGTICTATVKMCPLGLSENEHIEAESKEEFETKLAERYRTFAAKQKPSTILLTSNLGDFEVVDGDLSDYRSKIALSSGGCGDLAKAIVEKTNGTPYMVSNFASSEEQLQKDFIENPDVIFRYASHIVVSSPTDPNGYIDAFGVNDAESFLETYDCLYMTKMTPEMLNRFADADRAEKLSSFADAAIEMDSRGESYDISILNEYSWVDED